MILYEIYINVNSSLQLERGIHVYKIRSNDKGSYTGSRKGSIGTYTFQERALDRKEPLHCGSGGKFYTKDKSKLKEYGKLLDANMETWINQAIKKLEKSKSKLGSKWETNE